MNNESQKIMNEIKKAIKGKDDVIEKVLVAILAKGHILIEDVPGVGKTTLALAFSKALGLDYKRMQFTPDVVPSDIVGFSMYNRQTEKFEYKSGAVICNLFLADEINRTSSKTQSALLEVMEENQITVDGNTHDIPSPFTVIATQNPSGGAGTQMLPQAQLDRFLIKISMGYPDYESQIEILKDRQKVNPINYLDEVATRKEISDMQNSVDSVFSSDEILGYITRLAEATRNHNLITLGISPRGALALNRAAKAKAFINGKDFVLPKDVREVFLDVCAHRIILNAKARIEEKNETDLLKEILSQVKIDE
ncbi:MAG: MoxR family ATPase [Eubacteriales bacterium]|nr:MoxR family ATPase [Eubacteriales bacterium]